MEPLRLGRTSFPSPEKTRGCRWVNQAWGPQATCLGWGGGEAEQVHDLPVPQGLTIRIGGYTVWADRQRSGEHPVSCRAGRASGSPVKVSVFAAGGGAQEAPVRVNCVRCRHGGHAVRRHEAGNSTQRRGRKGWELGNGGDCDPKGK